MTKIERIWVMARLTPFDKLLMVESLKQKCEEEALTGNGTNDALALKKANVGLPIGIQGIEVAKESSNIIILDNNLNFVVNLIMDSLGVLALETKQSVDDLMDRKPVG
ncbi:hypothetical protein ACH5RR_001373 [Cinchona calisaya]|uniref:Uncharacterized protein n=1 Tax=Cinchona calisaya TaxID=153742 RepID=A0ABD3B373_9GENT